jgi:hypothetical protein
MIGAALLALLAGWTVRWTTANVGIRVCRGGRMPVVFLVRYDTNKVVASWQSWPDPWHSLHIFR